MTLCQGFWPFRGHARSHRYCGGLWERACPRRGQHRKHKSPTEQSWKASCKATPRRPLGVKVLHQEDSRWIALS
ncbi:hypothetical protein C1X72_22315 [Pseudomonas sp. FW306-2-2C-D06B]|nr:hypothetical protein C1X72_22315 [Pseudomonas sp. FW306-2-2C-D06B]